MQALFRRLCNTDIAQIGLVRGTDHAGLRRGREAACPPKSTLGDVRQTRTGKTEISMNVLNDANPIATVEQFQAALLATRDWNGISPMQLQMLQAQCRAPGSTISALQLAQQLQLKNLAAARLQYATFARALAEKLGYAPPQKGKAAPSWWFTLSTGGEVGEDATDGQSAWIMRPELVAALRAMKWA
jgi:hypothetical protein